MQLGEFLIRRSVSEAKTPLHISELKGIEYETAYPEPAAFSFSQLKATAKFSKHQKISNVGFSPKENRIAKR